MFFNFFFIFQAVELAMKFVGDRAYDVAKAACPRLAEIKCYEQVCSGQSQYCNTILLLLNSYKVVKKSLPSKLRSYL